MWFLQAKGGFLTECMAVPDCVMLKVDEDVDWNVEIFTTGSNEKSGIT